MQKQILLAAALVLTGALVNATQAPPQAPGNQSSAAPTAKPEEGIPITDATVLKACGSCHRPDDKSQMSRISFQRNTPEGWQNTIQRMAALNGLNIDAATARHVVKYLSNNLGLAPEEAKPAAWEVEKRWIDFKYTANADAESTCNKCHSLGRVISQRRTRANGICSWRCTAAGTHSSTTRRSAAGDRAPTGRSADGRPPDTASPGGEGDRSPRQHLPVEDARMDGVVRDDAAGAPRRHVDAERVGAGQGRHLRTRDDHDRSRRRPTSSRRRRPTAWRGRARPSPARAARSSTPGSSGAVDPARKPRIHRCVK